MVDFKHKGLDYSASSINFNYANDNNAQRLSVVTDPATAYTIMEGGLFNVALPDGVGVDLQLPEGQFHFSLWDFGGEDPGSLITVTFDFEPGDSAQLSLDLEDD